MDGTSLTSSQLSTICDSIINVVDSYNTYQVPLERTNGCSCSECQSLIVEVRALFKSAELFEKEVVKCRGQLQDVDNEEKQEIVKTLWNTFDLCQTLSSLFKDRPGTATNDDYKFFSQKVRFLKADLDIFNSAFDLQQKNERKETSPPFIPVDYDQKPVVARHPTLCTCTTCSPGSPRTRTLPHVSRRLPARRFYAPVRRTALGTRKGYARLSIIHPGFGKKKWSAVGGIAPCALETHVQPKKPMRKEPASEADDTRASKIAQLEAQIVQLATQNHDLRAANRVIERLKRTSDTTVKEMADTIKAHLLHIRTIHSAIHNLAASLLDKEGYQKVHSYQPTGRGYFTPPNSPPSSFPVFQKLPVDPKAAQGPGKSVPNPGLERSAVPDWITLSKELPVIMNIINRTKDDVGDLGNADRGRHRHSDQQYRRDKSRESTRSRDQYEAQAGDSRRDRSNSYKHRRDVDPNLQGSYMAKPPLTVNIARNTNFASSDRNPIETRSPSQTGPSSNAFPGIPSTNIHPQPFVYSSNVPLAPSSSASTPIPPTWNGISPISAPANPLRPPGRGNVPTSRRGSYVSPQGYELPTATTTSTPIVHQGNSYSHHPPPPPPPATDRRPSTDQGPMYANISKSNPAPNTDAGAAVTEPKTPTRRRSTSYADSRFPRGSTA